MPQSNPMRPTGREAHTIDFSMVERIEVIQGANAINGLGATGGTINIVTRRPEKGTFNQHVDVQATTPTSNPGADVMSYKTSYRADGRTDKLDYLFALAYDDQGLYLDGKGRSIGADTTQGDLMDARSADILGKLAYRIDDRQRLQLTVNRYRVKSQANYIGVAGDRQAGIPSTSVEGTPEGMPPSNDVWTSSVGYSHADLAGMELSAMAFNQEFEGMFGADNSATFQDVRIAPPGTLYDQSRAVASKYGSKVGLTKSDLLDGRLKLTAGFDTLFDKGKQDLHGPGRTYVPESEYRNVSLFVQSEYKPLDSLTLHAGVRKENADLKIDSYRTLALYKNVLVEGGTLKFNEALLNAGLVYNAVPGVTLFTSYSEGFGMPDIGRVLRSINKPGTSVASMRELAAILTKSVELGARLRRGPLEADVSYFRSDSDFGTRVVPVNGAFMMAREKTRAEAYGRFTHPKANAAGPLASLDAMAASAEREWAGGRPYFVRVWHPGDANGYVELRRSYADDIAMNLDQIYFDAASGAVLHRFRAASVMTAQRFISGLHFIQHNHWTLRWLYFFAGLAGCVLIATGFLFWLEARRARHAKLGLAGVRAVETLTLGSVTGIILATLAFFAANRLLPPGAELAGQARPALEVWAFYLVLVGSFAHAWWRARAAWREQAWTICALALACVLLNWASTGEHLVRAAWSGLWAVAGMDAALLALALLAAWVARRLGRGAALRTGRPARVGAGAELGA